MAGEILLSVRADGLRETSRALEGLRKDAAEAGAAARRASDVARASPTAGNNQAATEARALADRKRAVSAFETWRRGEEERTAREREHHLRRGVDEERRAGRSRLEAVQEFSTRALAVWQTYSARASALSGAFGGRSTEGMLAENFNMQMDMARLSRDTGMTRPRIQRSITDAARASGVDPNQILQAINAGGDVGGDAAAAVLLRNASAMSTSAMALGVAPSAIASPLAQALRMGMPEERVQGFLDQFVGLSTAGNLDPEALSENLGAAFSSYQGATGAEGEAAVLDAMRLQAVMGSAFGGAGPRAIKSNYDATMGMLSDEGFQRRLMRMTGTTGTLGNRPGEQLLNPLETLQTLAGSGGAVTREQFSRLAGSVENGDRLKVLMETLRAGGGAVSDVLGASGEAGAAFTRDTMADFRGIAGFGNQANQMANFMENGEGFATYADAMADGLDTMNSKFPMAVEGFENMTSVLENFISLMGGVGLMGGATTAAGAMGGAGGIGSLLGGTGATVAGVGGGVIAAGVVGAGLMGVAGYEQYQQSMEASHGAGFERALAGRFRMLPGGMQVDLGEGAQVDPYAAATGADPRLGTRRTSPLTLGVAGSGDGPAAPLNLAAFGGGGPSAPAAAAPQGRPVTVAFDPASANMFANTIAARMAAEQGRGPTER